MPAPDAGAPLAGQVGLVTGSARGIGKAIAERLSRLGAVVEGLDRSSDPAVDVTDATAVWEAVERVVAEHGRIDVLVNNAGVFPHVPFDELALDEWRAVLATNLDGVFICTRAVYPVMRRGGYGRIVNISSAAFLVGEFGLTHYVASKGGVIGLTRALAKGAGRHGITVNAVTPGFIATPGVDASPDERALFDQIVAEQSVPRRGAPEDIAACVAYLADPEASFITGQTINVDGGHRFI
jgi:NAD(P)-dependent dehydrogenase (short-subunit alcohol dehydrogenase family)